MSLIAKNIHFKRGDKTILHTMNLQFSAGEIVALLGVNGAGKSSLLQVLSGTLPLTSGEIHINGRLRKEWTLTEQAQMLAVLTQSNTLQFPLTVSEVVLLGRTPFSTDANLNHEIVQQCLTYVDMQSAANKFYHQLSGGECQRVQIARILAQVLVPASEGTRFILLDEPTSALDIAHQHQILRLLRKLCVDNIGIVLVVHDLNLAFLYADRVMVLDQGHLAAQGSPEAVLTADFIEKVFSLPVHVISHPDSTTKKLMIPVYFTNSVSS